MELCEALPKMLSRHAIRRRKRARRLAASGLRALAAFLFLIAGPPMALGRGLMRAAGRANGAAYFVERDRG